jgi:hypothetical protein
MLGRKQKYRMRHIAYSEDDWDRSKPKGDEGERIVFDYFEQLGYPNVRTPVPDMLSNLPFQSEQERIDFAARFKREVHIVDGYVKIGGETIGVEVKWKGTENYVVDVRKYNPAYEKLCKVMRVQVWFYIKSTDSIWVHDMRDPKAFPAFETKKQKGEPVYVIPVEERRLVVRLPVANR